MKRVLVLLITLALLVGMVGCPADPEPTPPVEYSLTISGAEGGSVTSPGEGTFTYDEGTSVNLVAVPASGYSFGGWTGHVSTIANVNAASTTITMNGDYAIKANFQLIPVAKYSLTISSTEGGSVTAPGQGTFTYDAGAVVELVAEAADGYKFMKWTGSTDLVANADAPSTTIVLDRFCSVTANFAKEIRTWYDLDAIREDLGGYYVLVNDLDSTTAGYAELAGPTANEGRGWEPIGSLVAGSYITHFVDAVDPFVGSFDGQGYHIRDLFINRPDEDGVGVFGLVGRRGVIDNVAVVNADVTGQDHIGGLAGSNDGGNVSNSYVAGSVTGQVNVGGLVGFNAWAGTVSSSFSSAGVIGKSGVGGLVGYSDGAVDNSHFVGSVTGSSNVGGLVGLTNWGTVRNSYYHHDVVLINGKNVITIGASYGEDFYQWLANDKCLDVNERLSQEDGYYLINDVNDLKQLLAFGQDSGLRFRLTTDLDLSNEPHFFIPYLAGTFDGNGHTISNLSFNLGFVPQVGLFGLLASGGRVSEVGVENVSITASRAGGLVGASFGTVSNSYSSGSITGYWQVGGLVGALHQGSIRNSYSSVSMTGHNIGGLVGWNYHGAVSNSYYNYNEVLINGSNVITIGALSAEDFKEWLAKEKSLDVNERLSQEDGYYLIDDVDDFKQLLAFGQDPGLRFRLTTDLDLRNEPGFFIPYLAGRFHGNGHRISNLSFNFEFVNHVGLFGYLASGGKVSQVGAENADITGADSVGSLVGWNGGTVSDSYSSGSVSGSGRAGGLVGVNAHTLSNSFSSGAVTGHWAVGGLVGNNWDTVSNSYSSASVTGDGHVGGLVGLDWGIVSNSFWDVETSCTEASDGGTGRTTAEMMKIATFSGVGWSIVGVADPDIRNLFYTWNIVDGQTYPFLSWQRVS